MKKKKLKVVKIYLIKILLIKFILILSYKIFIQLELEDEKKIILDYPTFILDDLKNIFDLLNKKNNFDIFKQKTKIENIFIFIIIFPFLKKEKEIIISKRNSLYKLFIKFFNNQSDKKFKINKNYFKNFTIHFKNLLNYKWEILVNRNITNYLRHIIYHYYSEQYLNIYEKSLNLNIKYYFDNNKNKSYELISDLMSKMLLFI